MDIPEATQRDQSGTVVNICALKYLNSGIQLAPNNPLFYNLTGIFAHQIGTIIALLI
jgi:hypothetical protein